MTNSASSRPNQRLSEAPQIGAVQDTIIPRALNAFIDQARSANAQGNQVERAVWLQAALMLQSDRPEIGLELIDSMLKQNRIGDGIQLAAQLVDRHPQHALALWHLGYALQLANRHADAISFYERAHGINPAVPTLRNNLAVAYEITGSEGKALTMLEEAVAANAQDMEAWTNLSRVYPRHRELERALAAGKRSVEINPSNSLALSNYSLALKEAQRWPEATEAAETAVNIAPGMPRLPFNLSILDLVQGNYARGWANFESRWDGSSELRNSHPDFPVPRWNGEALRGKTLLLWGEQGFGDALQFSRFVPMLAKKVHAQGGTLVWAAFKAVHPLMARMAPKGSNACRTTGRCPRLTSISRC
jgi:tetratricopeptide (TPR) repeat protein